MSTQSFFFFVRGTPKSFVKMNNAEQTTMVACPLEPDEIRLLCDRDHLVDVVVRVLSDNNEIFTFDPTRLSRLTFASFVESVFEWAHTRQYTPISMIGGMTPLPEGIQIEAHYLLWLASHAGLM